MKKSLLLTAAFVAVTAHAATASNEPQTVFTPENNPTLVVATEELNSVAEKKVETVIPLSPFYTVTERYKPGAKTILEMDAAGLIPKDVPLEVLTKQLEEENADTAAESLTATEAAFSLIGEGSEVAIPQPARHVITPGAPVQIARTLEEAGSVKAVEYQPAAAAQASLEASDDKEMRATPGLMTQFPEAAASMQAPEQQALPKLDGGTALVPGEGALFSITDPKTWRSAWDATTDDQKMALMVPGALAAFLIAFLLGKGSRKPVRIRK